MNQVATSPADAENVATVVITSGMNTTTHRTFGALRDHHDDQSRPAPAS